jgi:hypothetical protein
VPPGTDPTLDRAVDVLSGSSAGAGWEDAA